MDTAVTAGVQVEKEAVEVSANAQRRGNNLRGEYHKGQHYENIEEIIGFPASHMWLPL